MEEFSFLALSEQKKGIISSLKNKKPLNFKVVSSNIETQLGSNSPNLFSHNLIVYLKKKR